MQLLYLQWLHLQISADPGGQGRAQRGCINQSVMYGPSAWQLTTDPGNCFSKDPQPSGSSAGHPETLSLTRPVYRLARRCQDYEGTCISRDFSCELDTWVAART